MKNSMLQYEINQHMQIYYSNICMGLQYKNEKTITANLVFLKLGADGVEDEAGSGQGTNDLFTL